MRPAMAPPLPPEARNARDGGVASLVVLAAVATAVGWGATLWLAPRVEQAPYVYGAAAGVLLAFAAAWTNRRLKLGFLSHLAEQVTLVLVPPLALIFLVLGTIFGRPRHAHRGRGDGGGGRPRAGRPEGAAAAGPHPRGRRRRRCGSRPSWCSC